MRALLFSLVVVASGVVAEELDSMRLFFEPAKPVLKIDRPAQSIAPPKLFSYHYNGFISSEAGKRYFINGVPLSGLKRIELVSVSNTGRTVELKTDTGYVFSLSIGETRVTAMVQAGRKSE